MKKMKSLAFLLAATLSLTTVFAISPSPTQAAETGKGPAIRISLSANQLYLPVGGAPSHLSVITTPVVPNLPFTWKSENTAVASVNKEGWVTPVAAGTTKIDMVSPQGQVVLSCTVTAYPTVTPTPKPTPTPAPGDGGKTTSSIIKVKSVTLDAKDKTVSIGQTFKLTPTLSPANSSNPRIKWTISDPSVLAWKDGVGFTALKAGKAVITVTTADGGHTATCSITVAPSSPTYSKTKR